MNAPVSHLPDPRDKSRHASTTAANDLPSQPGTDLHQVWQLLKEVVTEDATGQPSVYVDSFDTRQQGE